MARQGPFFRRQPAGRRTKIAFCIDHGEDTSRSIHGSGASNQNAKRHQNQKAKTIEGQYS
jgi:hypothetical protein